MIQSQWGQHNTMLAPLRSLLSAAVTGETMFTKILGSIATVTAVLALASPAHTAGTGAGAVDKILMGGIEQSAEISGMAKGALNVVITTSSGPFALSCRDADLEGEVVGPDPYNQWLIINDMAYADCDGPSGSLMTVSVVCPLVVDYDDDNNIVTDDLIDEVEGLAYITDPTTGQHCIQVKDSISNGALCSFNVGGTIPATFDEDPKTVSGVSYQEVTINGPGLAIRNASCLGQVSNGDPIALTATFNIDVDDSAGLDYWDDLINFIPAP
jgi:hypothetical protein